LRGMSPDQVLVLIDGKRRHQFSALNLNITIGKGTVVTDMNTIPSLATDRLEILRDGAAAQYGSDAIAGIINVGLNRSVGKGTFKTQYGLTSMGDGASYLAAANYGIKLGKEKSYLNMTMQYQYADGTDRSDPFNGSIYSSNAAAEATARTARGVYPTTGEFRVSQYGSNQTEAYQAFANASYPINDKWSLYAFGGFSQKNIKAFEELKAIGIMSEYKVDDLCLVNAFNGDVLIEISIPANPHTREHHNHVLYSNQKTFFVRFDESIYNSKLRDKKVKFEEVEIKLTPCMFASDSALAITEGGNTISITERNVRITERITKLITRDMFTLYEREIVSRLVATANLTAHTQRIDFITTALPRGAYYSFLFQTYFDGFISAELVLDWFHKVDERVTRLRRLVKKGVHFRHPAMRIEHYSFMDSACDMMRAYFEEAHIRGSVAGTIEDLLAKVLQTIIEKDSFAKEIFELGVEK
ncbi:MAG: TonB-dependent receptor, partial [Runella slithyformis]